MSSFKKADALLARIAAGRSDLVFDYVAAGNEATARDGDGSSLLYWCARYGDVSGMRFLLAHGEKLDSIAATIGLEGAAYFGHWRLCEFLLENGADSNRPNPDTWETPLHAALCTANRPAFELVVRVLLAAGPPGLSPSQTGSGTNETHRLVDGDRLGAPFARGPEHCSAAPCPPRPIAPSLVDTAAQTVRARRSADQPARPSPPGSRSGSARDRTSATHPRVRGTDGQSRNPGQ